MNLDWSLSFFLISTGTGLSIFFMCLGISFITRYRHSSTMEDKLGDNDRTIAKLIMLPAQNPLYNEFTETDDDDDEGFH